MPKVNSTTRKPSTRHDPLNERDRNVRSSRASAPNGSEGPKRQKATERMLPLKALKKSPAPEKGDAHPEKPLAQKANGATGKPTNGNTNKNSPQEIRNTTTTTAIDSTQSPTQPNSEANYIIQVRLDGTEEPCVQRLLSIPPSFTFEQVHEVLQIAFNWANCHQHDFTVWLSDFKGMTMNSLPMGPDATKMTIQSAINFEMFGETLGDQDSGWPTVNEEKITLREVYENPEYKGKAVVGYQYDMGDSWTHIFCLLGRASPDLNSQIHAPEGLRAFCLGGEGHHVAEDCGSTPGWEDLKEAFKKKRGGFDDRRKWYTNSCINGGEKTLDPFKWDIFEVNERLAQEFSPEALEQELAGGRGDIDIDLSDDDEDDLSDDDEDDLSDDDEDDLLDDDEDDLSDDDDEDVSE